MLQKENGSAMPVLVNCSSYTYKAAKMVRKKHKTYAKYNSKNHPAYRKANKEAVRFCC